MPLGWESNTKYARDTAKYEEEIKVELGVGNPMQGTSLISTNSLLDLDL